MADAIGKVRGCLHFLPDLRLRTRNACMGRCARCADARRACVSKRITSSWCARPSRISKRLRTTSRSKVRARCVEWDVNLELNSLVTGFRQSHIRDGAALVRYFAWLEEQLNAGAVLNESQAADQLEKYRSCVRFVEPLMTRDTQSFTEKTTCSRACRSPPSRLPVLMAVSFCFIRWSVLLLSSAPRI